MNRYRYIESCDVISPISNCDHCTIICKLSFMSHRHHSVRRTVWNFKRCDVTALCEAMDSAPWDLGFNLHDNIDDVVGYWSDLMLYVMSQYIPNKVITVRDNEKPWVNSELKQAIRRRGVLWKRYKRTGSADHFSIFKLARNKVVNLNRSLRNAYFDNLGEELS